jgi:phospholipase/carboxylesterase
MDIRLGRRRLLGLGVACVAAPVVAGVGANILTGRAVASLPDERLTMEPPGSQSRLTARPGPPAESGPLGLRPLGLGTDRDGLLYVPPGYQPDTPAPLVLMLHGAGSKAERGMNPLRDLADDAGLILLAVDSRRQSWDVIYGQYGPDVAFIDAVEGFSDGASYALSLGITNGDLFTHVMAFSPGFVVPAAQEGTPRLFVSHGTRDEVLPIDACSRKIVPRLKRAGYDVAYHEFDGGHAYPPETVLEARRWFTDG